MNSLVGNVISKFQGSKKLCADIYTDNFVFRLHYKITAKVLFIVSLASVALMVFDWIRCFAHNNEETTFAMITIYCWMQNSFVLPYQTDGVLGDDVAHYGIDGETPEDKKVFITYYQWLPIMLMFQGFLFEIPHMLWKRIEKMEILNMTFGFQNPIARTKQNEAMSDEDMDRNLSLLAESIQKGWSKSPWKFRPFFFIICLVLNCANCVAQIFFMKWFYQIDSFNTAWEVFYHLRDNFFSRNDALITVFPRMAKCQFRQFGAAGSVQTHDVLCLLPFNVYTEKLFALCLLWFTILSLLSALSFVFWVLLFLSSRLRGLLAKFPFFHMFPKDGVVSDWVQNTQLDAGNWFIMWLVCKNVHPNHLEKLIPQLTTDDSNKLKTKHL